MNTLICGKPAGARSALPVMVDADGRLVTTTGGGGSSATPAASNVTASATSVTILAANTARKGATIYNAADKKLYLSLASPATTDNALAVLADNSSGIGGYYEVPFGYTGAIYGIWAAAPTGKANITELS